MADVGPGIFVRFVGFQSSFPSLDARRLATHIVLESNRLISRPKPTRTAKIRNSRFCADSRAGENNDRIALSDLPSKFLYGHHRLSYRTAHVSMTTGHQRIPSLPAGNLNTNATMPPNKIRVPVTMKPPAKEPLSPMIPINVGIIPPPIK